MPKTNDAAEKINELKKTLDLLGKNSGSVLFTNIFAPIIGLIVIATCFLIGVDWTIGINLTSGIYWTNVSYNFLIVVTGALLGWALGMFFSPFSEKEGASFSTIGQTVSVFVSGYVVSKLDRFLEATLFDAQKLPVPTNWWRTGLLFASLLLVMLTVFSNRAYFQLGAALSETEKGSQVDPLLGEQIAKEKLELEEKEAVEKLRVDHSND